MRRFFQWLFKRPVTWLANKVSSSPHKKDVFSSLSRLHKSIVEGKTVFGIAIPSAGLTIPFDLAKDKYIVFSDQHKGAGDFADDFRLCRNNYLTALEYYLEEGYTLINLGDAEELWENTADEVIAKNEDSLQLEAKFIEQNRYYRIFGNHDLAWKFELNSNKYLKPIFGEKLKIYEGLVLDTTYNNKNYSIFFAHGHQGDKRSDGNAFSMWVVSNIWTPIQRFLNVSINTVANSIELVDKHNIIMYEWSLAEKNTLFISGHTHKPVFASMDHVDRLTKLLEKLKQAGEKDAADLVDAELTKRKKEYAGKKLTKTMVKPTYFNTGCCCFIDGDITGIEIEGDSIRLIKWEEEEQMPVRKILEQSQLTYIFDQL